MPPHSSDNIERQDMLVFFSPHLDVSKNSASYAFGYILAATKHLVHLHHAYLATIFMEKELK